MDYIINMYYFFLALCVVMCYNYNIYFTCKKGENIKKEYETMSVLKKC